MNSFIPARPTNEMMSSLDIAELTEKEHFNVVRDIKHLVDEDAISPLRFEESTYRNDRGKEYPMYLLDFQATMTLITGYDAKRRSQVIARWVQLEQGEMFEQPPMDEGSSAVSVPRLEEAARGVKAGMFMAKSYGYKDDVARQYVNNVVRDITGIDTLSLLNIPVEEGAVARKALPDPREETTQQICEYLEECCTTDTMERVGSSKLYFGFCSWVQEKYQVDPPHQRLFGLIMGNYHQRVKINGVVHYTKLSFKQKEVV